MSDRTQEAVEFGGRTVPPATPPVINDNTSAVDAATLPKAKGDSDFPGNNPDEINPGQGDTDQPGQAPLEETPGGGDSDQLGETPQEVPEQPIMPSEAPPPD